MAIRNSDARGKFLKKSVSIGQEAIAKVETTDPHNAVSRMENFTEAHGLARPIADGKTASQPEKRRWFVSWKIMTEKIFNEQIIPLSHGSSRRRANQPRRLQGDAAPFFRRLSCKNKKLHICPYKSTWAHFVNRPNQVERYSGPKIGPKSLSRPRFLDHLRTVPMDRSCTNRTSTPTDRQISWKIISTVGVHTPLHIRNPSFQSWWSHSS